MKPTQQIITYLVAGILLVALLCWCAVLFQQSAETTHAATFDAQWEQVAGSPETWRLPVPGGWLYHIPKGYGATTVFVPDLRKDAKAAGRDG